MIRFEAIPLTKGCVSTDELSLFTLALGASKPRKVVDVKFSKGEDRLELWLDFAEGPQVSLAPAAGDERRRGLGH